jgi:hypothetical protein
MKRENNLERVIYLFIYFLEQNSNENHENQPKTQLVVIPDMFVFC